jgi:transcriptional regulator with XRE-family HTH domain
MVTTNIPNNINFTNTHINDKVYAMSKNSMALTVIPPDASKALATLGEHLALARIRRKESQRKWAQRMGVSVPTLIRMERGDPGVSIGIYVTALWLIGLAAPLGEIASPEKDLRALEVTVRDAAHIRAVRKQVSVLAQMGRIKAQP